MNDDTKYSESYLRALIKNQAEETISLEFKANGSVDFSKDKNKIEMSKDVSAMANSAGGIIIYGINEVASKADSFSYIDGGEVTKETIEQVIQSNIQRTIDGLRIYPIRLDGKINQTVIIIEVPESENAPHMAGDKLYYKRFNFKNNRMEEYEVRNLYYRRNKPKLQIEIPRLTTTDATAISPSSLRTGYYQLFFHIRNTGTIMEKDFKVEISIPVDIYQPFFRNERPIENYHSRVDLSNRIFVVPNTTPIFQEESQLICNSYIVTKKGHFQSSNIDIKLFYNGGIEQARFTLEEIWQNSIENPVNYKVSYKKLG